MKRLNILIIFLALTTAVHAQKQEKPKAPNIEKAKALLDKGDSKGAKDIIDYALIYEKTKDKVKTHYYAGLIYENIFYAQDSLDNEDIDPMAFDKCVEGYKKVKTLENEFGTYYNFADIRLNNLYGFIFNKAAQEYQNEEYDQSIRNFDRATKIVENDTIAITYAGYAAQQAGNDDLAMKYFTYLADHKMADPSVHRNIIYIYRSVKNDTTAALQAVEKARAQFPEDEELKQDEITMMILTGRIDNAKRQLEDAISKDPGNYLYYYELGFIHDEAGDYENSVKNYEKCLEINPDYFEANFNLGVQHYNVGAEKIKAANFMSVDEFRKKGKAIEEEAHIYFNKSLPYFEKCRELQADDIPVLQTLSALYGQLKMPEKMEIVNKELDALGAEK
ncbi:MAG TPA: tetratricopeptide repeat protein [Cyclobacteriaceae bacterium]|nr:tetratricopeptide repeat protein [Cyclobacteriaceae bacterium]